MSQGERNTLAAPGEPDVNNIHANASPSNGDPFKFSHGLTGVDQRANYLFVNILIATMLVPVILTLLHRILIYRRNERRRVSIINAYSGHSSWRRDRYPSWAALKKHLIHAPLIGDRHSRELRAISVVNAGTIPTRPQFLVIIIYAISNIAYCLAVPKQLPAKRIAEFRGRCGALAAFNLIFTILFALRNNPFIWILGVSFSTFNLLHRWTARLATLEAAAHVAAFMLNTYRVTYNEQDGWNSIKWVLTHSVSYRWGLVGFTAFIFISLQSLGPLRRAFYDVFLTLHRLGVIVAVSGIYFHMAKHALPQLPWVYLSITLLVLEALIRATRITYYNSSWKRRMWTRVIVEALSGEATRVTFSIPRSWNDKPGSHIYIYIPRIAPLSSHPFSVAWHDGSGYAKLESEKLFPHIEDLKVETGPSSISCIVRARSGMTRALYDRANRSETDQVELWGVIEGPYGAHHALDSYGTVVLFAGGVGITHQLPFVRHLLIGYSRNTSATRRVVLIWCITDFDVLEWIYSWLEELADIPDSGDIVEVQLYISRSSPQATSSRSLPFKAELNSRRCDPQEILDEQILVQVGAMVVTVCGPGGFNDCVRAAVRQRMGLRSIDFFEESFSS